MLTSEKAALAKCSQIWDYYMEKQRYLPKDKKVTNYIDKDFGPQRASDLERCKFAMYKTGEIPRKGYTDPRDVEFMSA